LGAHAGGVHTLEVMVRVLLEIGNVWIRLTVVESSSDEDSTDAPKETEEETKANDGGNIFG
jgi:hypothetical protein